MNRKLFSTKNKVSIYVTKLHLKAHTNTHCSMGTLIAFYCEKNYISRKKENNTPHTLTDKRRNKTTMKYKRFDVIDQHESNKTHVSF